MKNLAGKPERAEETNYYVREELERCSIEIVEHEDLIPHSEVPTNLTGKLGDLTFTRAWYYWVVSGYVPLEIAEKLYADPVGKKDIRIGGHCGCPAPGEYGTKYFDEQGRELVSDPDGTQARSWDAFYESHPDWSEFGPDKRPRFVPDAKAVATRAVVDGYHIDSELGLYIFVQAVKDAGLV